MDLPAAEYIRHRLTRYEQSVEEISAHFSELSISGPWCASAPYYEKCVILALLDSSDCEGDTHTSLVREYHRITQKLEAFRNEKGREYRDHLFADLRNYVHIYHAAVCHLHLGQTGSVALLDLSRRELIAELLRELERDYDLLEIGTLTSLLDENLPREIESVPNCLPEGTAGQPCTNNRQHRDRTNGQCPITRSECRRVCTAGSGRISRFPR